MRRTAPLLPIALLAVAASSASAAPPAPDTATPTAADRVAHAREDARTAAAARAAQARRRAAARARRPVAFTLSACLLEDAAPRRVTVLPLDGDARMRALLDGDDSPVTVALRRTTAIVPGTAGAGTQMRAGHQVWVRWKAPRTTRLAALPAATRVVDLGPTETCAVDADDPDLGWGGDDPGEWDGDPEGWGDPGADDPGE